MGIIGDREWMQQAYKLAVYAADLGEVPVGAIIVSAEGQVLGSGYNISIQQHDPCAHAELCAIRQACHNVKNYRLPHATLYTTLEPCLMCAGAMLHARIKRLVFATRDFK